MLMMVNLKVLLVFILLACLFVRAARHQSGCYHQSLQGTHFPTEALTGAS